MDDFQRIHATLCWRTTWHRFACSGHPSPRCPCPTWLRSLDSCARWTSLNIRSSQKRIVSCVPCGVSPCQHIAFNFFHILIFVFHVLGCRDDRPDAVLSRLAAESCGTTRFWSLPVSTNTVVRSLRMNGCMSAVFISFCLRSECLELAFRPMRSKSHHIFPWGCGGVYVCAEWGSISSSSTKDWSDSNHSILWERLPCDCWAQLTPCVRKVRVTNSSV